MGAKDDADSVLGPFLGPGLVEIGGGGGFWIWTWLMEEEGVWRRKERGSLGFIVVVWEEEGRNRSGWSFLAKFQNQYDWLFLEGILYFKEEMVFSASRKKWYPVELAWFSILGTFCFLYFWWFLKVHWFVGSGSMSVLTELREPGVAVSRFPLDSYIATSFWSSVISKTGIWFGGTLASPLWLLELPFFFFVFKGRKS